MLTRHSSCTCGRVRCQAIGAPIVSLVCYCDDCQEGARNIEALPNAAPRFASRLNNTTCFDVIDRGPYGYEHVNVAKQRRDPNSMLNWAERIIRMRKEVPEVGWGDFKVIAARDPAVLVMRYDDDRAGRADPAIKQA
jgi:glycosidase